MSHFYRQVQDHTAKFSAWLFALTFFFTFLTAASAFAQEAPEITADAAIVVDADTGKTLFEKNANKPEYPASMTKVMTAVLALESGKTDRIVEVSENAADVETTRLHAGDQARMSEFLKQMLLVSDNGCATAIGESLAAGDIDYFVKKMNDKAASLGMTSTHFVNANGMPNSNHVTTAADMSRLMMYAIRNDAFRKLIAMPSATVTYIVPEGRTEYCVSTDELLGKYPGILGGKTGWTSLARSCFMAAAERDGHTLVVVVMHSADDETRFSEAASLLDYGFAVRAQSEEAKPIETGTERVQVLERKN